MAWLLVAVALVAGCGSDERTPEDEIAEMLARFEESVGAGDTAGAADILSDDYRDREGRDARSVRALLLRYMAGQEAIHVFSRLRSLELADPPTSAHVVVAAALAGAPIESPGELATLSADLWRFELDLAREDDGRWRVVGARWRNAQMADFL